LRRCNFYAPRTRPPDTPPCVRHSSSRSSSGRPEASHKPKSVLRSRRNGRPARARRHIKVCSSWTAISSVRRSSMPRSTHASAAAVGCRLVMHRDAACSTMPRVLPTSESATLQRRAAALVRCMQVCVSLISTAKRSRLLLPLCRASILLRPVDRRQHQLDEAAPTGERGGHESHRSEPDGGG
jgi:hypothetical protein